MSPRVLLVDDHASLLTALKRLLEASYAVVGTVRTGAQALETARCLQPDVIVVDVNLPDIDGLELCRQMALVAPRARIVVLTAAHDPAIEQKAFDLGAAGFVAKHCSGDELIPTIAKALGRASDPPTPDPVFFPPVVT